MRRLLVTSALLALLAPALQTTGTVALASPAPLDRHAGATSAKAGPALRVTTKISGLNHPWDIVELPSGTLLLTEREPARLSTFKDGTRRTVAFPRKKIWVSGETGLMGLEVDPAFATNHRFYTCSGWKKDGGGHDVRVNAWKLNAAETRATLVRSLVSGFPTTSGRHGGCRLLITANGSLLVGTGDAAVGTNPRNLKSLGGKTLRLDRMTGKPWPQNPFIKSPNKRKRYVQTFGHRNVQGLAERKDGTLWSVEHGPDINDEVNLLVNGGDYGWNPVPGYNESVPMTDQGLPGKQVGARWRSGDPTIATSGSTFVYGEKWGSFDGALWVAALAGSKLVIMDFNADGRKPRITVPGAFRGDYGRLRTVVQLSSGNVLVATDDDGGRGKFLLVRPR